MDILAHIIISDLESLVGNNYHEKLYEEADLYREIIADEYATPTQKNSARRELALVEEALANKEA